MKINIMPSSTPCFVAQIDLRLQDKLREDLLDQGFQLSTPPYTLFSAKKNGISCTLYISGKLTVQGKGKDEFITFYLEPEILGNLSYSHPETSTDLTPRIGIDEAGKGDYFGPLCIAGVQANESQIKELLTLGVRDSKRINDTSIKNLSQKIKQKVAYTIVRLTPNKYNDLYNSFHNLNRLLAWSHATAIEDLVEKTGCKTVTIDQFADESVVIVALRKKKLDVSLTQRHRGEEDVVVAAASILARAAFLEGLEDLSTHVSMTLPKGAAAHVIKAAKEIVAKHGEEVLKVVAKLHFKMTHEILGHA